VDGDDVFLFVLIVIGVVVALIMLDHLVAQ
jgi:hypothetical protein